jgi:hypothetical protein
MYKESLWRELAGGVP